MGRSRAWGALGVSLVLAITAVHGQFLDPNAAFAGGPLGGIRVEPPAAFRSNAQPFDGLFANFPTLQQQQPGGQGTTQPGTPQQPFGNLFNLGLGGAGAGGQAPTTLAQQFPLAAAGLATGAFVTGVQLMANMANNRPPSPPPTVPEFFVQVSGGNFVRGLGSFNPLCQNIYPAGLSKFEFVEAGAGAPVLFDGKLVEAGLTAQGVVRRVLDDAAASGVDLLRINAFAVDGRYSVLSKDAPTGAITTNQGVLAGLDYVLEEARKRSIRVLLVLTDYFSDQAGGPLQYLQLAGVSTTGLSNAQAKALFYTNSAAQAVYRSYVEQIVSRVNTINGRSYKADPTIFGYDAMNEPRCEDSTAGVCILGDGTQAIRGFTSSAASLIKSLDPVHLVTVGLDGFYTTGAGLAVNPFSDAATYNADFLAISSLTQIDFASFNVYPDLWGQENQQWVANWIAQHAADGANVLNKPVIIKELGMQPTANRDSFYGYMYADALAQIDATKAATGGLRGAAYFQAFAKGTEAVWWTLSPGGRFGIYRDNSTYSSVSGFATATSNLEAQGRRLCPAGNPNLAPQILPVQTCPTGFEGANCNQDINECVRGTDDCALNAACINTQGSFHCQCHAGFTGNGRTCTPEPAVLAAISERYYSNFGGNCLGSPADVPYPTTAPGWVYDPTTTFGATGNRVNVTLLGCKSACDAAASCTSFFWDAGQSQCFLKTGECPFGDTCIFPTAVCSGEDYQGVPPGSPTGFQYVCGQGYSFYKKDVASLPSGCAAPTATVTTGTPSVSVAASLMAGNPKGGLPFDLVFGSASQIRTYNHATDSQSLYYIATNALSSLAVLPTGRIAFTDSTNAVLLEAAANGASFSAASVSSTPLSWTALAAGGSEAQPVLWGASASAPYTFAKYNVAGGAVAETVALDSAGLGVTSVERFAVDPQGLLWVLYATSAGTRVLAKAEAGQFVTKLASSASLALCDVAFDAFGYLFASSYDPSVSGSSCSSGVGLQKSGLQVGLLPSASVSLAEVLAPAALGTTPSPRTLAAGPHSAAANFRGGNAVLFWAVSSATPLRWSDTIYAPNLAGGVDAPLVTEVPALSR